MSAVSSASHEVLDLVSEADEEEQPSSKRSSSFLRPPQSSVLQSLSDSEADSAHNSPRKRQRLSVSPSTSPARSLASNGEEDESASVETLSTRDTRDSDNDDDDDVIDFSDLDAHASHSAVLHTSTPITPAAAQPAAADHSTAASTSGKKRKQAVVRYFGGEDLSLKCFNCGAAGHKSEDCPADKPCYICGQSLATHTKKKGCPNEPCWRCGGIGHQKSECTAARFLPRLCYRCGSTSHEVSRCTTPPSSSFWDLSTVHCYVCGQPGHINCSPPSFSSTPLYCCNCASPYHQHVNCRQDRMMRDVQVEEYSGGGSAYKRTMECFRCGQIGHSKAECTWSRTTRRSAGSQGSGIVGRSGGAGGMRLSYSHSNGGGYSTGRSASEKGSSRYSHSRDRDDRYDRQTSSSRSSSSKHQSSSSSSWRSDRSRSGEQEHYTGRKRKL